MRKLKLFLAACALMFVGTTADAETDYTSLMSSNWTGSKADFQGGREFYNGDQNNFAVGKIMYQSFTAPVTGIYEIKFYAVTSCTAGRYTTETPYYGDNIAQAYATAGSNKATVAMTVINQTGCTLVADANIRTLSIEAAQGETIEYGLENIATGGNWYTIKELSAKMKTVAEIFQDQYDEAYAIWQYSTENEDGARDIFKTYVDALNTALSGTLAEAQTASDNLAAALVTYESKSYPIKGNGIKYDFTSKMNMAINAWTCKQGNGPAQYGFTGATETYGNTNAGEVMYQTITGLANGEYEIHFYAVANAANGGGVEGTKTTVYANDQELEIDVIKQSACTPSDYERTFTVMVTDGTIQYGIKNTVAAGNWYICKNVALFMTGAPDLSDYYDVIAGKLTTANSIKNSPMNGDVATALQDAIDATAGYYNITVISSLETMSDNLTTAINNANTSIANYEAVLTVLNAASSLDATGQAIYAANAVVTTLQNAYNNRTLEVMSAEQEAECTAALDNCKAYVELDNYADALVAVGNDNDLANQTLTAAISTAVTSVGEATTAEAIATATTTLKNAMVTYVGAANPTAGNKFDLTFMLTNPDVSGFANGAKPAGWYCEYSGSAWNNPGVNRNAVSLDGTKDATFEFWTGTAVATNEFTVCQKVTLPIGTYEMSCLAFADANNVVGATNNQVYFYANDTQGSKIISEPNKLAEASISFVNSAEQEVKIGLKACAGNQYRWMGIGYVELYKVPAVTVTIDETVAYTPESVAGEVTLKRTLSTEKWNTFVVPFQITNDELKNAFGDGVAVAEYSESVEGTESTISFTKMATPEIMPNKPVLLKPSSVSNTNEYVFANRTVATGEAKASGTNFDFVGTYTPTTYITTGNYYFYNGGIYKSASDNGTYVNGTRAYIKDKTSSARIVKFVIDDEEAASIDGVEFTGNENGKLFNLAGQELKKAQKGIFIQNGKKVVIK